MGIGMVRLKRALILVHRWLGIAGALLCVSWFASGLVLLVAPYPGFRVERSRSWAPPLDCSRCTRGTHAVLAAEPDVQPWESVRVGMQLDQPVLRARAGRMGAWHALSLDASTPLAVVDAHLAESIARRALGLTAPVTEAERLTEPDQWSVEFGYKRELPLWRLRFGDDATTDAYVSEAAGEVVLTSTRRQRTLAWFGAIPHWLYPRWLRAQVPRWRWTVVALSALTLLMTLTGVGIGVWTFRWRVQGNQARSPYARDWMRWHHWAGLLFGVITITWLASGLLSVDPFDWDEGGAPSEADRAAWQQRAAASVALPVEAPMAALVSSSRIPPGELAELELSVVRGHPVWIAHGRDERAVLVRGDELPAHEVASVGADSLAVRFAVDVMVGSRAVTDAVASGRGIDVSPVQVDTLPRGDNYVAPRPGRAIPLPLLRVRLPGAGGAAYYLDPRTGRLVGRHDALSRRARWLYTGLHDLDLPGIEERPALRLTLIVLLSLGGLAASVSGTIVGWRRLRRTLAPRATTAAPRS